MVKDFNKKIGTTSTDGIKYNYLNLPTEIKVENPDNVLRKIEYVYDAAGSKLKKTVTTGSSIEITEYCGGFVYNRAGATANALLQFFPTEEGYVTIAANGDFKYTYQYKDHLGNVRLSYTDTNGNNAIIASEVIEESNYYPFGLKHGWYNNVVSIQNGNSTAQKWKYNDTEYNESFALNMYEMPFRSYDPALARWTTIDPILHYSMSTYNAFDNNPVFWADPSGADAYDAVMNLFNKAGSGITSFRNDNWGGFKQTGHMSDEDFNRMMSGMQEYEDMFGGGGAGIDPPKKKSKGRPEDGYLRKKVSKNGLSEILSKFNPDPNGGDLGAIARYLNSEFEENTVKWYSHGSINGTGGGMNADVFSDYLEDNSTLFKNRADNHSYLMVKLFACDTGQLETVGGLAYELSREYPNMIFMAPTTHLTMGSNSMRHENATDGSAGYFNVYQNGRIIDRQRLKND